MPTYDYKCPKCNSAKQIQHKMNDMPCVVCDKCFVNMNKGFGGGIGLHFKGTGFYETDYKGK